MHLHSLRLFGSTACQEPCLHFSVLAEGASGAWSIGRMAGAKESQLGCQPDLERAQRSLVKH